MGWSGCRVRLVGQGSVAGMWRENVAGGTRSRVTGTSPLTIYSVSMLDAFYLALRSKWPLGMPISLFMLVALASSVIAPPLIRC